MSHPFDRVLGKTYTRRGLLKGTVAAGAGALALSAAYWHEDTGFLRVTYDGASLALLLWVCAVPTAARTALGAARRALLAASSLLSLYIAVQYATHV